MITSVIYTAVTLSLAIIIAHKCLPDARTLHRLRQKPGTPEHSLGIDAIEMSTAHKRGLLGAIIFFAFAAGLNIGREL